MAAGDVEVYGPVRPDQMDATLTGNGVVVADSITMAQFGVNQIVVLVVKAA